MTSEEFFPPTVELLSQALLDLKNRVLARIALHFIHYPAPVNELDTDGGGGEPNYLQLLDYWVSAGEQDKAFIMELRADGFTFESWEDEPGTEHYETLDVEVLIDLVRVLDKAAAAAAQLSLKKVGSGAEKGLYPVVKAENKVGGAG